MNLPPNYLCIDSRYFTIDFHFFYHIFLLLYNIFNTKNFRNPFQFHLQLLKRLWRMFLNNIEVALTCSFSLAFLIIIYKKILKRRRLLRFFNPLNPLTGAKVTIMYFRIFYFYFNVKKGNKHQIHIVSLIYKTRRIRKLLMFCVLQRLK